MIIDIFVVSAVSFRLSVCIKICYKLPENIEVSSMGTCKIHKLFGPNAIVDSVSLWKVVGELVWPKGTVISE